MNSLVKSIFFIGLLSCLALASCKRTEDLVDFTQDEELLLGEKLAELIATSENYSIIPQEGNSLAYDYVNSRLNEITSSTSLRKSEDFQWSITLLDSEERSAFVTPGGYIYINSALLFFLENEDQFSGLIAHMVAHVDSSHVLERLFFEFGVNNLKSITSGNDQEALQSILSVLDPQGSPITFSRANEIEADNHSVTLLTGSGQSCAGGGLFINRMLTVQPEGQQAFLSVHSGSPTRAEVINTLAETLGCSTDVDSQSALRFRTFRNSLPR
ncbi:MAG: M48 family metallopeptidase [Ekhidna sp.]|uniref:M48 family metallopeptidase n=1 Tax=Ekhidna sp. TaxID=2608089 RepID=UPI0032EBBA56